MREYFITRESIAELLHHLSEDVKTFFKQEIKLVAKEMSENFSKLGHDAAVFGIGVFMASAGSVLLLAGMGFLLAFAFQALGLDMLLAVFVGFVIIGLPVTIGGAVAGIKGIKAISKDSLVPQRTLNTVTGEDMPSPTGKKPTTVELHRQALGTKQRIGEEGRELTQRVTQIKQRTIEHIKKHPLPWSLAALSCVLTGGYFIGRKFWRA